MIHAIRIRRARPEDARGIAAVHVESWRSAYAGILPDRVMVQMSVDQKAVSWRRQIETTANSQGRWWPSFPRAASPASPAAAAPPARSPASMARSTCSMSCPTGRSRASAAACSAAPAAHGQERRRLGPGLGAGGQSRALLLRGDGGQARRREGRGDLGRHPASDRLWLAQPVAAARSLPGAPPPMKQPPAPACPPPNLLQSIPLRERRPASR